MQFTRNRITPAKKILFRDYLVSDKAIRKIQLIVEKEKYCFDNDDSTSTRIWVEKLKNTGELMHYYHATDKFALVFCTNLGRSVVKDFHILMCLDSTHRTTAYNYNLFTLVTQNIYGQGIPVAYLISSDGKSGTIKKFLPAFKVGTFMTDNDDAEIEAIRNVESSSNACLEGLDQIKIDALKLVKTSRKTEIDKLIGHLTMTGPRNLSGELVSLQSVDFKTIAISKCNYMTSNDILDVIKEYDEGELTFDQFKTVLSADCASKWNHNTLHELSELQLYDRLPSNFLESKSFNPNRMDPDRVLTFLNRAFNSERRENIIWSRWTSKLGFKEAESIFKNPLWSPFLWQSINVRNFAHIRDSDIQGRAFLANFIGLKDKTLEFYSLNELISRFYTLLSFIKYYSKLVISDENEILKAYLNDINRLIFRIMIRIKAIDESSHRRLECLLSFTPKQDTEVNEVFINFLKDSENIKIGDWFIGILFILSEEIYLISFKNLKTFLKLFFNLRPSHESILFTFKLLRELRLKKDNIDYLFFKCLKDKPEYLIEFYKSNINMMPRRLIPFIPLRIRFIENLKNRYNNQNNRIVTLSFDLFIDPNVSDLERFLEISSVIGWNKLTINNPAYFKVIKADDLYEKIEIEHVIKSYFELFLYQKEFYEILGHEKNYKPIIRILPVFPSELWRQFANLLTLSVLLNMEIPFTIEFDYFNEMFRKDDHTPLLFEMSEKATANKKFKGFYEYLSEDFILNPLNIMEKLAEFSSRLESIKRSTVDGYNHPCTIVLELFTRGFESFIEGLQNGLNLNDFTIEEVHKLIFYRK